MRKWMCLTFAVLLMLTGCKSVKENEAASDAVDMVPISDLSDAERVVEEKQSYAKAYYDVLTYLLDEYGVVHEEYDAASRTACVIGGLEYAELADLENDGVPELICAINGDSENFADSGGRISVFRYADGTVKELLKAPYGGRADTVDDAFLYVGDAEGKPFFALMDIVAADDSCEYFLERISIYTIDNGKLQCRTALGMANCQQYDEYYENIYVYTDCRVDGKPASVEEYSHLVDKYTQEARKFSTTWYDFSEEMLEQPIKDMQAIIDGLAEEAEVATIDLSACKQASKSLEAAPYENAHYIPSDIKTELGQIAVPAAKKEERSQYEAAKRELLQELAAQYWSYWDGTISEDSNCYQTVDFENDGLPEIVFSYMESPKTFVYTFFRYSNGRFDEVLRVKSIKSFEAMCTFEHKNFVFSDSRSEEIEGVQIYKEDKYLIKSEKFVKTSFQEMPDVGKWLINGQEVSEDNYCSETEKYLRGEFFCFSPCFENGVSREEAAAWIEEADW